MAIFTNKTMSILYVLRVICMIMKDFKTNVKLVSFIIIAIGHHYCLAYVLMLMYATANCYIIFGRHCYFACNLIK